MAGFTRALGRPSLAGPGSGVATPTPPPTPTPTVTAVTAAAGHFAAGIVAAAAAIVPNPPTPPAPAALPLPFYLQNRAGTGPAAGAPTVLLWYPGAADWFTPAGALSSAGDGTWWVGASGSDQPGPSPILLYATAADAVPTAMAYFAAGASYVVGQTSLAVPLWLGLAQDPTFPAAGLLPAVSVSAAGGAYTYAPGQLVEAVGIGQGNGFYLYTPAAADVQAAGYVSLYAASPGATPTQVTIQVGAFVPAPTPTPTPPPTPTPTPSAGPYLTLDPYATVPISVAAPVPARVLRIP